VLIALFDIIPCYINASQMAQRSNEIDSLSRIVRLALRDCLLENRAFAYAPFHRDRRIKAPGDVIIEFCEVRLPAKTATIAGCAAKSCDPDRFGRRRDGLHLNLVAGLFRIEGETGIIYTEREYHAGSCSRGGGGIKVGESRSEFASLRAFSKGTL